MKSCFIGMIPGGSGESFGGMAQQTIGTETCIAVIWIRCLIIIILVTTNAIGIQRSLKITIEMALVTRNHLVLSFEGKPSGGMIKGVVRIPGGMAGVTGIRFIDIARDAFFLVLLLQLTAIGVATAGQTRKDRSIIDISMAGTALISPQALVFPAVYWEIRIIMIEFCIAESRRIMAFQTVCPESFLRVNRFIFILCAVAGDTFSRAVRLIIDKGAIVTTVTRE